MAPGTADSNTLANTRLADAIRASAGSGRAVDERLRVVIVGHVDHGKSTVIGRLLADTGSLPKGKLDALRAQCERNAKPFEYAFLLDALKDEQAQGITIDAARVFFTTAKRRYIIVDAPGHIEFVKNMVTGASRAEAALLVIDAKEGVRENSRRHGYLLSMLGISQIVVLVNKMDLVGYDRAAYDKVVAEYGAFLDQIGIHALRFLPVAAWAGDNIAARSAKLSWYDGPTVLETLDELEPDAAPVDAPLRMPVQGVYKFTERHDNRRIIAGTVETGRIRVGDEIVFYPSGKKTRVESIEAFNRPPQLEASAGQATGFTVGEQVYVSRGEVATRASEPPPLVTTRVRVNLFWLGNRPLVTGKDYLVKLGTARVAARIAAIHRVLDGSELSVAEGRSKVEKHQVADCSLALTRPLAFDVASTLVHTSRFVIVDDYEICGGGIIREGLPDAQTWVRDKVLQRNAHWDASRVSEDRRAERYSQRPTLVLVTGDPAVDRKGLARDFEAQLFDEGRHVYFLGMGNIVHGVDADIPRSDDTAGPEHVRRLAEVANILLDAGMIVIAAAAGLSDEDAGVVRTAVGQDRVNIVWLGDRGATDLTADLVLPLDAADEHTARMKQLLQDRGIIFRPR